MKAGVPFRSDETIQDLGDLASGQKVLRRRERTLLVLGAVLAATGVTLFVASVVAPAAVDKLTGVTKVAIEKQLHALVAPDELPQLRLGAEGGLRELDQCDGTFTEMIGYRMPDVPPLFAAHNNCGGDIILGWDLGQRIRVAGSDIVYEVIEERHTPKWSHLEVLKGMPGTFMVQTCYYGENTMRFLAMAPVPGTNE